MEEQDFYRHRHLHLTSGSKCFSNFVVTYYHISDSELVLELLYKIVIAERGHYSPISRGYKHYTFVKAKVPQINHTHNLYLTFRGITTYLTDWSAVILDKRS